MEPDDTEARTNSVFAYVVRILMVARAEGDVARTNNHATGNGPIVEPSTD
jgi:hypothetical protein